MKFHKDGSRPLFGHIFVFGSNLAGVHGAGAALAAKLYYGAEQGNGVGLMSNNCYAIPTKDGNFNCLTLEEIKGYVDSFVEYVNDNPNKQFFITRVGCGLAGNLDEDIAPMFKGCGDNCSFAIEWQPYLLEDEIY